MVLPRRALGASLKRPRRANHDGEPGPIAVQIAGTDAQMMAEAAAYNVDRGAQIIDINMGCPAKKVCNKWAGSALMQNEALAVEIAQAVVEACAPHGVPVTLKMRTGWCDAHRNAVVLARRFEEVGIQMLTVHGRTREQGYKGFAEYDTIAAVKAAVRVPVVANGDITSPEKARDVLAYTDRKSTRLNSSHLVISYAVFCLKKKTTHNNTCLSPPCRFQRFHPSTPTFHRLSVPFALDRPPSSHLSAIPTPTPSAEHIQRATD